MADSRVKKTADNIVEDAEEVYEETRKIAGKLADSVREKVKGEQLTRAELYEKARNLGIKGRSKMNKKQLAGAVDRELSKA